MQDLTGSVVIGFDGSASAGAAVDWAAKEAYRRGAPLVVVYATDVTGVLVGPENVSSWLASHAEAVSRETVEAGVARARKTTTEVTGISEVGGAARTLTHASESASLLVVGTRGHGHVAGGLLGSVAFAVTSHSSCPVVVVRGESGRELGSDWPIMVAVDGSVTSDAAVEFAAGIAASSGAALHLVSVWQLHAAEAWSASYWAETDPGLSPVQAARAGAEELLESRRLMLERNHPQTPVQTFAVEGFTSHALTEASAAAGLLVMGSRGRGGLAGLVLGSCSRAMLHSSQCPVAVVTPGGVGSARP